MNKYTQYVTKNKQIVTSTKVKSKRHPNKSFILRQKMTVTQKRGAVTAVVVKNRLQIGWSLCNSGSGDRFSSEQALNLSEGRAINQHKNSLEFKASSPPSMSSLAERGVPHSTLPAMCEVIRLAFQDNKNIDTVEIFREKNKTISKTTPVKMWKAVKTKATS